MVFYHFFGMRSAPRWQNSVYSGPKSGIRCFWWSSTLMDWFPRKKHVGDRNKWYLDRPRTVLYGMYSRTQQSSSSIFSRVCPSEVPWSKTIEFLLNVRKYQFEACNNLAICICEQWTRATNIRAFAVEFASLERRTAALSVFSTLRDGLCLWDSRRLIDIWRSRFSLSFR